MVFPSVHLYLDPPTSWNQQQQQLVLQQQQQQQSSEEQQQQTVQAAASARPDGAIRPNSMADRARLAKIPQPEQALKCPRCDSTNTKFCYFNNYSLSQPRHFCKACRRYWTRGGALRNVPVGGGCRRNKRSSSKSSASSKTPSSAHAAPGTENRAGPPSSAATSSALPAPPQQQLPFMTSLHPAMMDYGGVPNIGLGFSGMQSMDADAAIDQHQHATSIGFDQWRLNQIQQFPFFGGLESQLSAAPSPGIYPLDGQAGGSGGGAPTGSELITQMASVKMEDNNARGLHFARQYLGISPRNDQFWAAGGSSNGGGEGSSAAGGGVGGSSAGGNGGGWMTNLPGFNSSSAGRLL